MSKKTQIDKVNTVIGHGTKMEGHLNSRNSIRIDGEFNGEISSEGTVLIGKDGIIHGNIKAGNLTAEGLIEGNIYAENSIHLIKGCQIKGDITAQAIEIEKGAVFNGRSIMSATTKDEGNTQPNNPNHVSEAS